MNSELKAVIFDLDNTLARATEPLPENTARGLSKLTTLVPVAIMSGASFERVQRDVLSRLPPDTKLENLYLFPDTGARCYIYKESVWKEEYKHPLGHGESERITGILEEGLRSTGILEDAAQYGERILRGDAQVTLAALGHQAPAEMKAAWDPDRAKRAKLKTFLDPHLPEFDVRISSRTAIDITKKGVDKALAVRWLATRLHASVEHMLFVGDDFSQGGNDAVVIPTRVQTRETSGPDETARIIEQLVAMFEVKPASA